MNVPRYVIAGGASLVIHAALLFVAQESKVFAMPAGSQSNTVSINFTPKSVPSQAQQKTITEPVKPEPIKETVSQAEPKTVEPKQAKPTPKKKAITNKPQPKKVEKKVIEQKVVEKKPVQKKPVTEKKVVKKERPKPATQPEKLADKKVDKNMDESANQPQEVNQGVSNQEPVLVTKPSFSARPTPPNYPRQARRRGVEGVATYEIWLDAEGKQIKQALVNSSGALMLDNAALDAIKQWKFSPHTVNGRAIAHRVQIPVRFRLD
ncbi:TonB family protein [Vibrio sp. 10N.222.51.C8]|uniref:energy transducer TonB n=1 Tax=unclassified Vibrio TaxID=2614977 RepID=UPI0002D83A9B|nr:MULTISPECIES: energy transducer TonB [unclassified Vibrio]ANP77872.1 energy transducer TonB [Vibrio crassostreae 9CS106]OCH56084.1 energy transducer TonB [Vibrio sp. ZF57]PMK13717.1 energy transducer TonB [Vibrio sp. 10N.261.54.E10]PMK21497.1 energy transducer TonB [Vibrio sp. 10N.261.54.C3]PMK81166.1 energy transducer TonB [Vibrio sp. 10N.261.52.E5]